MKFTTTKTLEEFLEGLKAFEKDMKELGVKVNVNLSVSEKNEQEPKPES